VPSIRISNCAPVIAVDPAPGAATALHARTLGRDHDSRSSRRRPGTGGNARPRPLEDRRHARLDICRAGSSAELAKLLHHDPAALDFVQAKPDRCGRLSQCLPFQFNHLMPGIGAGWHLINAKSFAWPVSWHLGFGGGRTLGRGHEPAPVIPACASVRLPSRAEPRRPPRRSSHWWHAASDRDGHIRPWYCRAES